MAAITISNLSSNSSDLSFSKLTDSEMDNVCGGLGWDDVKEGVRDFGSGVTDGLAGKSGRQSNFNYLAGNTPGLLLDEASEWNPG
jgi:hypothetical protein